ncbi:MAG: hypothetical protein AB9879_03635 [Methanothrix sp.]
MLADKLANKTALFVLLAAVFVQTAYGSGGIDATSLANIESPSSLTSNSNADQVQEKMADALNRLSAWREDQANKTSQLAAASEGKSALNNSRQDNSELNNSSLNNSSLNDTIRSDSALNRSTLSGETSASPTGVATDSKTSFNGYYGITASRHEMGKSDIKSSTQLSGAFEIDKSVKFQDRGF